MYTPKVQAWMDLMGAWCDAMEAHGLYSGEAFAARDKMRDFEDDNPLDAKEAWEIMREAAQKYKSLPKK